MTKNGFTLIEIIVFLVIITLIGVGSFVGVKVVQNNKEKDFYSQFDDALNIYLELHNEIYINLRDNVEGAVITLDVLKNEGLIKDNIIDLNGNKLDYIQNYYILSDAVISNDKSKCENKVSISILKSWDIKSGKYKKEDVMNIC